MPDLSQRAPVNQAISGVLNQVSPTQVSHFLHGRVFLLCVKEVHSLRKFL